MLKNMLATQKTIFSNTPNTFTSGMFLLSVALGAMGISFLVGFIIFMIVSIYSYYHLEDSIFQKERNTYTVLNLYVSGYSLFFVCFIVLWCVSISISIIIQGLFIGDFNNFFKDIFVINTKDILEMIFAIILYQCSIFYMLHVKIKKGFTKHNKRSIFLCVIISMLIIFFFTRTWLVDQLFLQNVLYVITAICFLILPMISLKTINTYK